MKHYYDAFIETIVDMIQNFVIVMVVGYMMEGGAKATTIIIAVFFGLFGGNLFQEYARNKQQGTDKKISS